MRKKFYLFLSVCILTASINVSHASVIVPATPASTEPSPAAVKAAIEGFRSLPKKERKEKIKEVKKEIKEYKALKRSGKAADTNTLLLVILAILLPPLAVYLYEGEINSHFWISLILTLLFWLPGIIYALIIILGNKK